MATSGILDRLAAYSCGGSSGSGPDSLLPEVSPGTLIKEENPAELCRCQSNPSILIFIFIMKRMNVSKCTLPPSFSARFLGCIPLKVPPKTEPTPVEASSEQHDLGPPSHLRHWLERGPASRRGAPISRATATIRHEMSDVVPKRERRSTDKKAGRLVRGHRALMSPRLALAIPLPICADHVSPKHRIKNYYQ